MPSIFADDLNPFKIDRAKLLKKEFLVQGAQGVVYKANFDDQIVAVKELHGNRHDEDRLRCMLQLQHDALIRLLGFCDRPFSLVMPLCEGNLQDIICDDVDISSTDFYRYMTQIAYGMQYLHQNGVVHRDLKPENILMTSDFNVKICDFDLSKEIDFTWMSMSTLCGTPLWMAPEMAVRSNYTKAIDVWSFAVVVWEMMTQRSPYDSLIKDLNFMQLVHQLNENKIRLPFPSGCSYFLRQLMTACLKSEPTERPSFNYIVAVLQHVKIKPDLWNTLKPKWRTLDFDYSYSEESAIVFDKGLEKWKKFTDQIRAELRRLIKLFSEEKPSLQSIKTMLRECFTTQQKTVIQYVLEHDITTDTIQPSIEELFHQYNRSIQRLQTLRGNLLAKTQYCDSYAEIVLFNLQNENATVRAEGFKRFVHMTHDEKYDQVQDQAVPFIMNAMRFYYTDIRTFHKAINIEITQTCSEILAEERMTEKLKLDESPMNVLVVIAVLQRNLKDKVTVRCMLSVLNSMTPGHIPFNVILPIFDLLKPYRGPGAKSTCTPNDIWTIRCCWEILQKTSPDAKCAQMFLQNDGLIVVEDFAREFSDDFFILNSIYRLSHPRCGRLFQWSQTAQIRKYLTSLCDYIDTTRYHAFFSFPAVVTLSCLLDIFTEQLKSCNQEVYIKKGSDTISSWEYGEIYHGQMMETTAKFDSTKGNALSRLLQALVYADVALTDPTAILIETKDTEFALRRVLTNKRNPISMKAFAEITLDVWKKLTGGMADEKSLEEKF